MSSNVRLFSSHRRFSFCLLTGWILVGYLFLQPSMMERRRLSQQAMDLESMLKTKQQHLRVRQMQRAQFTAFDKLYQDLSKRFFTRKKISLLLAELAKIGMAHRLKFEFLAPLSKLNQGFYQQQPFKMVIKGRYQALILFLNQITQWPTMLTVDDFELSMVSDDSQVVRAKNNLELTLQASIYRPLRSKKHLIRQEMAS